jgi:hypothetical protein
MFLGSLQRSNGDDSARQEAYSQLRQHWPGIADALFGTKGEEGGWPSTPPFSIILFVEGHQLKFCLRSDEHSMSCFGCVRDIANGFDGLENALQEGQFSWRPKKERKRT